MTRILASKWIKPVPNSYLQVPEIPKGRDVVLPGQLSAVIYDFPGPQQPSVTWKKDLSLSLVAELNRRFLPGSAPISTVNCRYPIVLNAVEVIFEFAF